MKYRPVAIFERSLIRTVCDALKKRVWLESVLPNTSVTRIV